MDYDARGKAQAVRNLAPKSKGGKGQEVKLYTTTGDTYSTVTRKTTRGAPLDVDSSGIEEAYNVRDTDGVSIKLGDLQFMLSPVQLNGADMPEPSAGDILQYVLTGDKKTVVSVERVAPAGLVCYYTLQLRS